ncbi:MAG: T9SS type A sorting domain-containing protein [Sphingobacteriaceae bacterium]|nr:T9SS type A sorting domain-containing protein [Sphingobacteriaceae bacterium]
MKKIFTLLSIVALGSQLNAQIFHKKYNYTGEIMNGQTSVVNNNRIYNASSSMMLQGQVSIQKTDLAGNHIVTRTILFGTSTPVVSVKKMITIADKLYIVGSINPASSTDGLLLVVDTNITTPVVYAKSYGTAAGKEDIYDILQASNTDLVMVGNSTVPTATIGVERNVPFVVRVSVGTGNPVYQKIYDDGLDKLCYSVAEDVVNNTLFISGAKLGSNSTHIFKITSDAVGVVLSAKDFIFSSQAMYVKKLQVYGSKVFMIGGDPNNNLMTVETDLTLNTIVTPKYYTNFRYHDMVKVGNRNYIAGLSVPTGTFSYLSAMRMDSVFNYQIGMTYSLVPVPVFVNWSAVNVVNKSNTMYWIAQEGWTAPGPYTNRYIVGSDMALNATCGTFLTPTMGNNINTIVLANPMNPPTTFTVVNYNPFPNAINPTITTLCSATGIENVNESFEKFVINNDFDKVIIESPYSEYTINVFDLSGKLISTVNANAEVTEVNTSHLASGIYVIKLNAKGYEQRQKIVKQ